VAQGAERPDHPQAEDRQAERRRTKAQAVIGTEIVLGLKPSGTPDQWKGEVYNPKDGNTYTGYFTMTGADTAVLKGCALGFICKSQTWTRAPSPALPRN
jgi:uncharacterized protein (DUF2147 family)